jgi:hypothetical protein
MVVNAYFGEERLCEKAYLGDQDRGRFEGG